MMPMTPIVYGSQRGSIRASEKDVKGLEDLEEEVENALRLVESTPSCGPSNTALLDELEETPRPAELDDLEDTIEEAHKTLQNPVLGNYDRPHYLTNLLLALRLRHKRTYEIQYPLEGATQVSPNYLRHESLLNDQGFALQSSRHRELPTSPALFFRQLIQNAQRNVDAFSVNGDDTHNLLQLQFCLHNLVVAYRRRYERMKQIEDIQYAVEIAQQAVDYLSHHEQQRAGYWQDLASTLLIQYERTQAGKDLERAVEAAQRAVYATPNNDHSKAACQNTLGLALMKLYTQTADIEDLDAAIRLFREAISFSLLKKREPKGTGVGIRNMMRVYAQTNNLVYLNQTGGGAILRHIVMIRNRTTEHQEDLDQLEQNLGAAQRALDSTPKSHPAWAEWSTRLGYELRWRYVLKGHAEDIDNAVEAFRKAVDLTPTDFPERTDRLAGLGWAYLRRNIIDDLDNALQAFQQAVDSSLSSAGHDILMGLGISLGSKDPKKAIEAGEKAVYLTPPDHFYWAPCLICLSYIYNCQYSKSHEKEALDDAIGAAQQAMPQMKYTATYRPYSLFLLGRLLMERSKQTGEKDISDAIEAYQEAVNITSQDPGGPIAIYELVSALRTKSDRTGKRGDIEDLEATLKQAADLHWKYSDEQPWNGPDSFLSSSFAKH